MTHRNLVTTISVALFAGGAAAAAASNQTCICALQGITTAVSDITNDLSSRGYKMDMVDDAMAMVVDMQPFLMEQLALQCVSECQFPLGN